MKNRIKERRAALGVSQEWVAEQCGISQSTVAGIEAGKHNPNVAVAIRIARALNTTAEELFIID